MTSVLSGFFDGGFLGSAQKAPDGNANELPQTEGVTDTNSNNDSVSKINSAAVVNSDANDFGSPPREKVRPHLNKNRSEAGGSLLVAGQQSSPFRQGVGGSSPFTHLRKAD